MHEVSDDGFRGLGGSNTTRAVVDDTPGVTWKIIRKGLFMGLLEPLGPLAAVVGRGPRIEDALCMSPLEE